MYKGFEAVRDNSGSCVDKHCGNASPLCCLSECRFARVMLLDRTPDALQKPGAYTLRLLRRICPDSDKGRCTSSQVVGIKNEYSRVVEEPKELQHLKE